MPRMTSGASRASSHSAGRHFLAVEGAQDVPGNGAGGVAVPAVVHGQRNGVAEVRLRVNAGCLRCHVPCGRSGQDRVKRDGEGLLGHPAFPQLADQVLGTEQRPAAVPAPEPSAS